MKRGLEPAAWWARGWQSGSGAARSYLRGAYFGTGLTNLAVSVVGGLGGLVLARVLGPTVRGQLVLAITWPTFSASLACIGLPQAACFHLARADAPERPGILATATALSLVLGLLVAGLGTAAAPIIARDQAEVPWLRLMFLVQPVSMAGGVWVAALQATNLTRWNLARNCQLLGYFASVVSLALAGALSLGSAVVSLVGATAAQSLLIAVWLRPLVGRRTAPARRHLGPLLRYGVRTVTSGASWLVNAQLDQLVLSLVVTSSALANYAVAVSFSQLTLPLATAFGAVAFPRIAAARERAAAQRLQRAAVLGGSVSALVVLVPLVVAAPWIMPILFGPGYGRAVAAFWLLAPGAMAFAVNYVLSDVLRGWGRPLAPAVAEGIAALATIVLLAALVPALGIDGAAAASSIAYGVGTFVLWRALPRAGRGGASVQGSLAS